MNVIRQTGASPGSCDRHAPETLRPARSAEPVRLIFDTDICGDCDDVLALGMIHALQSRGHCRLLAVTISVDNEQAAPFVNAVNTFYGRGDIPIGVVGKGGVVEKSAFLPSLDREGRRGHFDILTTCISGRTAPVPRRSSARRWPPSPITRS